MPKNDHRLTPPARPTRRTGGRALIAAVGTFLASMVVFSLVLGHPIVDSTPLHHHEGGPQMTLTANVNFSITSSVAGSPSCTSVALLLPGAPDYLCYTVHNPFTQSITVTSMSVSSTTSSVSGCPISNLDMSGTSYSGTPALVVAAHGAATVGEPISMVTSATNQDSCLGTVFNFANVGKAHFTTSSTTSSTTTTPTTSTTPPAGSSNSASTAPSASTLAFTGADIASMFSAGVLAVAVGLLMMAAARRRRRRELDEPGGTGTS